MAWPASLAAADLAALQHLGGEVVSYAPSNGLDTPVAVTGLFHEKYVLAEAGSAEVVRSGPAVFLTAAEVAKLPVDPEVDSPRITIRGTVYKVRRPERDGQGGVTLMLQET